MSMPYPTHIVAAGAFVTRGDDVLLVKTARRGWEFPGGQVENGEDVLAAVAREVLEEAGVIVNVRQLVGIYSNIQSYPSPCGTFEVPTKLMMDFNAEYISGELRTSEETSEVMWCPIKECESVVEQPFLKMRIRNMTAFDGKVKYAAYQKTPYIIHCDVNI